MVGWENTVISDATSKPRSTLSAAGYDCHHFGKEHDFGSLHGFKRHDAGWEPFNAPEGCL